VYFARFIVKNLLATFCCEGFKRRSSQWTANASTGSSQITEIIIYVVLTDMMMMMITIIIIIITKKEPNYSDVRQL